MREGHRQPIFMTGPYLRATVSCATGWVESNRRSDRRGIEEFPPYGFAYYVAVPNSTAPVRAPCNGQYGTRWFAHHTCMPPFTITMHR